MGWASALLALGGTALSGILSKVNNDEARRKQKAAFARKESSLEAKAAEDPLARTENQQAINQYDRNSRQQIENAQGVAAITGATPEYGLSVQKAIAEGRADLMGNIAAKASERSDKYKDAAEATREASEAAEQEFHQQRNEQYGNLAANAMTAFGSLIDAGGKKAQVPSQSNAKLASATPPAQKPPSGVSQQDWEKNRNIISGYVK